MWVRLENCGLSFYNYDLTYKVTMKRTLTKTDVARSTRPVALHRYTLLAVILIAFAGLLAFIAPTDFDVWWHLRTGQLIVDSGIPYVNDYSYTELGRPWVVYEWLSELIMYAVYQLAGYVGLEVLFGAVQAGAGVLVYRLLREQGAGRILALLLLLVFFLFAAPTWGVRPQILAAPLLATFYLILSRWRRKPANVRPLWLLPLLSMIWANLHGTYVTGLAVIVIFLVGEAVGNWLYRPASPTPLRPLVLTLLGCLAATLVNPYFVRLWLLPLGYVSNGGPNPLYYVDEWKSPDFHDYGNYILMGSFILLMWVGITRKVRMTERERWRISLHRYVNVTDALLVAAFTMQALQGAYTTPVYGVIVLPILVGGLVRTWPQLGRRGDEPATQAEGRINLALAVILPLLLAALIFNLPQAQLAASPRTDGTFPYPEKAAQYLAGLPPTIRMYNDFGWGGFLIYRLYPQQRVFIDGRVDVYRGAVFEDFMNVQNVSVGWREALTKYDVDTVLIQRGTALDYALSREAGWGVGYQDNISIVYRRQR